MKKYTKYYLIQATALFGLFILALTNKINEYSFLSTTLVMLIIVFMLWPFINEHNERTIFLKHKIEVLEKSLGEDRNMINFVTVDQIDSFNHQIDTKGLVIGKLFLAYDYQAKVFIAVDDTTNDFWVEQFETIDEAIKWLKSKDKVIV